MSEPAHNHKLYIETVGCQMNMLDSELVVAALRKQGYDLAADPADADTILFNTCSVRDHAEQKIYSALGRLRGARKLRPAQVIGVIGCMAQKDQQQIFRRAPFVDLVVGTVNSPRFPVWSPRRGSSASSCWPSAWLVATPRGRRWPIVSRAMTRSAIRRCVRRRSRRSRGS